MRKDPESMLFFDGSLRFPTTFARASIFLRTRYQAYQVLAVPDDTCTILARKRPKILLVIRFHNESQVYMYCCIFAELFHTNVSTKHNLLYPWTYE